MGDVPAVLFDAPSTRAARTLLISPGSPVEVVTAVEGWVKVRESGGRLAWAETRAISPKRTLVVTVASAVVRAGAADSAAPVFEARQGLILELVEAVPGWARVKHRDGLAGFIRVSEVWGL